MVRTRSSSVLILCEGSKTEPNYLAALLRELRLTAVKVPRNHNTSPLQLVREAIAALKADPSLRSTYVIFDRDTHESFDEAVRLAEQSPFYNNRLRLIRSFPCFEVWLLYHLEACRTPMTSREALDRLTARLPSFDKADHSCLEMLIESGLLLALRHARQAAREARETDALNPSTEMHILVSELLRMAPGETDFVPAISDWEAVVELTTTINLDGS